MALATISGVALRPGVSKNGRYYSPDMIEKAVKRAQERLADPEADPINLLTHHDAEDDSTQIVGAFTSVKLGPDGEALYEADMPDTPDARTILSLIDTTTTGGRPFLHGCSIRGYWLGDTRETQVDGATVITADDLELDGLDFTKSPGVPGARVNSVSRLPVTTPAESAAGRHRIYESAQEARVTVSEDATVAPTNPTAPSPPAPAAAVVERWADHGYGADPVLPIGTPGQARASWARLQEAATRDRYTGNQLYRIKQRTQEALRRSGVEILPKGWLLERAQPTPPPVREYLDWYDGPIAIDEPEQGSFTARIDNGVVCVSISSWKVDPHDLTRIARAAMVGAADAMDGLDPDMDGDLDAPGAAERAPAAPLTEQAPSGPGATPVSEATPAAADPAGATSDPSTDPAPAVVTTSTTEQEGASGMAEPTTTPAETPAATPAAPAPAAAVPFTMTDAQFTVWMAAQAPAAPAAAQVLVGAAAESAPAPVAPVTETTDQIVRRVLAEQAAAAGAPAAPVAPVVAPSETVAERAAREAALTEAAIRNFVQTQAEAGGAPARQGHVVAPGATAGNGLKESSLGGTIPTGVRDIPFHEHNAEEQRLVRNALGAEIAGIPLA